LALHLRRRYQVLTAVGALSALQILMDKGAQAVIVSDMRMPDMDGGELLERVQQLYPDMTRILLSGELGGDAAISNMTEGAIFRHLTKPCPPDQLLAAVAAGVALHLSLVAARCAKGPS
jgi:DNA-binding NtrC family response regulator